MLEELLHLPQIEPRSEPGRGSRVPQGVRVYRLADSRTGAIPGHLCRTYTGETDLPGSVVALTTRPPMCASASPRSAIVVNSGG